MGEVKSEARSDDLYIVSMPSLARVTIHARFVSAIELALVLRRDIQQQLRAWNGRQHRSGL